MRKAPMASVLLAVVAICGTVAAAADDPEKVRISGQALNFSNIAPGGTQRIQIVINDWSTLETRERLILTFLKDGQDGLLEALQDLPAIGRWNFPGYMGPDPDNIYRLGTPIRFALRLPMAEGGQRIVIMTDRAIGFREHATRPRTIDYPFTLMEMRFDKDGEGQGRMAWYTRISLDKEKKTIELENFSSEPVRLNMLKLEPRE